MIIVQRGLPEGADCPECNHPCSLAYSLQPDPPIINTDPDWKCAECMLDGLFTEALNGRLEFWILQKKRGNGSTLKTY